jgi:hypothetical protein
LNRTKLKNYAPQARRDFIQAMTDRAAYYGLTAKKVEPVVERGDVAVIAGREFPRAVAKKRKALDDRIQRHGFERTMEAMAYTWFNRLVAIRFMELHGYLDHGYRALSHPEGKPTPEILEHAEHVELPGLKKDRVIDLKLAENKDSELYRLLLTAQCNALHTAMPFLFERIDDETELLLPDNLLHSDSLIRKLVGEIDEEDWQEVEVIGWLYQFYISERKDEVIGKLVASEDIPAATQLFTPNWIVKYLVQNTLGRQWLATYPQSALRQQMQYYVEPAEQTPEVQEQLKAITPTSLNPEDLTLLDPACGSGHILVEGYDLFKAIYLERGYRAKDIPALILQKNLFGLEIDDRAAQLAAFALIMKARADDRRILDNEAEPNVLAFQESQGMNAADISYALNTPINKENIQKEYLFEEVQDENGGLFSKKALADRGHISQADIASLLALFENAKTFGSLIQVPPKLAAKLPEIEKRLEDVLKYGDLMRAIAQVLKPLLQQARLLARQYDAVVANPPYMGKKFYNPTLKAFVGHHYSDSRTDLYACFITRSLSACRRCGRIALITIPNWMFLSGFHALRYTLLSSTSIESVVHNGRGVWGSDFGSCSFAIHNAAIPAYDGTYRRLFDSKSSVATSDELIARFGRVLPTFAASNDFLSIPGCPVAYWVSDQIREAFRKSRPLSDYAAPRQGLATTDNGKFLRFWYELPVSHIKFHMPNGQEAAQSGYRWFPYNKGGAFRKWYGNMGHVVNWQSDGAEIKQNIITKYPYLNGNPDYVAKNTDAYFLEAISWSKVTMGEFTVRYYPAGYVFDVSGCSIFSDNQDTLLELLGYLNSVVAKEFLSVLAPTVNYETGHVAGVPVIRMTGSKQQRIIEVVSRAIALAKADWESAETSWDFVTSALFEGHRESVQESIVRWANRCQQACSEMQRIEQENNHLFMEAFGVLAEMEADVARERITLANADVQSDVRSLVSYALGCAMARYSLDKPGLIYAHSGNQNFDPSQYKTFRGDDDGIIPLQEADWGVRNDATNRFVEFIGVAWPKERLEENLKFVADSLGPNNGEQPRETIRRYLATGFYKHHLQMYKKRPIYWLFSSGKQRAFQCLVYLHRYHEGTLARMRTEYFIPLQGQIVARVEQLEGDKAKATSTSHRKKLQKQQDDLKKQQAELLIFEEKLKHAADQKISLDLDDGVKANYGKFGDLLAEAKAITGGKDDE